MPKISVIIPVYNVEKYLERCINSVINQELEEAEKEFEKLFIQENEKNM